MLGRKIFKSKLFILTITTLLLLAIIFTIAAPKALALDSKVITDMSGRKITVEKSIGKVYGISANATIYLYTLAPEKLAGTNYEFNSAEKKYIPAKYQNLTVLGNFSGSKTSTNLEALIKASPDVLIMTSDTLGSADKEEADKLQKQTGIPVYIIDGQLDKTPQAYLALGELLNLQSQAKKLSTYCTNTIKEVNSHIIPASKKVTVFFGNGVKSLDTAPSGSAHSDVFEMVGAKNVAVLSVVTGRMEVGLEQVIKWNPSVIMVNGEPKRDLTAGQAAKSIMNDKSWSTISAVKNKKVYSIPKAPYAWVDRPPGPNRIIGLLWAGKTLYPSYYKKINMIKEIKNFYSLFYHVALSDSQVKQLLSN